MLPSEKLNWRESLVIYEVELPFPVDHALMTELSATIRADRDSVSTITAHRDGKKTLMLITIDVPVDTADPHIFLLAERLQIGAVIDELVGEQEEAPEPEGKVNGNGSTEEAPELP